MTVTIGASSKRTTKSTCRKCNRTVYVVLIDGIPVATDPELINVVAFDKPSATMLARRVHAEMCFQYVSDAERLKAQQERKRAANTGAKRPVAGRREPGQ